MDEAPRSCWFFSVKGCLMPQPGFGLCDIVRLPDGNLGRVVTLVPPEDQDREDIPTHGVDVDFYNPNFSQVSWFNQEDLSPVDPMSVVEIGDVISWGNHIGVVTSIRFEHLLAANAINDRLYQVIYYSPHSHSTMPDWTDDYWWDSQVVLVHKSPKSPWVCDIGPG